MHMDRVTSVTWITWVSSVTRVTRVSGMTRQDNIYFDLIPPGTSTVFQILSISLHFT